MKKKIAICLLAGLPFFGCKASAGTPAPPRRMDPVDGVRVAWDYSTMQKLGERGGYVRVLRMQDGSVIAVYENYGGDAMLRRSYDNGRSWSEPIVTFAGFEAVSPDGRSTRVHVSNPEIIQLANGDIVLACNYRPRTYEIAPFSIVVKRSSDNGATWSEAQSIYDAAPRFTDGCWEPSFLEFPDGRLQVYFANENPYQSSDEQEISVIESFDGGVTWEKEARTVSFRKDRRDGMPVARIMGDEIVVVIEDNNIDQFKPYTVRTLLADNWSTYVGGDSPMRDYCLKDKVPDRIYMGAPYLLVLPGGEAMISYQSTRGRGEDWELSTFETAIGDAAARNFDRITTPVDIPLDREAKWGSLALWDENTVAACFSSDFMSPEVAPWMILGHIIPELTASRGMVEDYPVIVGRKGNSSLRAGIAMGDGKLLVEGFTAGEVEKIEFTVDCGNQCLDAPDKGIYKVVGWPDGKTEVYEGSRGKWETKTDFPGSFSYTANTFTASVDPAASGLFDGSAVRINFSIEAGDGSGKIYRDTVSASDPDKPYTWLKVNL